MNRSSAGELNMAEETVSGYREFDVRCARIVRMAAFTGVE
jgi:hypothetical protein